MAKVLTVCLALIAAAAPAAAQTILETQKHRVRVVELTRGLDFPWALQFLPDGRMLVTERSGGMRYVGGDGALDPRPIAGMPDVVVGGQGGLLDVLLAPDFATSQRIYLSYSGEGNGGAHTHLAIARLDGYRLRDAREIFRAEPHVGGGVHFGGRMVFGPDGKLYLALGERGQRNLSQDLSVAMGKIVRLEPDGTVPKDNPFLDQPGAQPEIFSYGHRNPQGLAVEPGTGLLWLHEHGPQGGDEVNIARSGRNYGWPVITYGEEYGGGRIGQGLKARAGMEQPQHYWVPSIAPSGLAFYAGDRFPGWKGNLLVGALKDQLLSRLERDGEKVVAEERLPIRRRVRDVRVGPDGYVYLLTDEARPRGAILRLAPAE